MTHIQIAASKGMKAGYKARKRILKRSGLPTAKASLRESFGTYCSKFGPDVTAAQATMRNKPRNARVIGVEPFADTTELVLADRLAEARQRLAELEAEAAAATEPPKPRKRTRKPASTDEVRENLWREWAVRKHSIPTKVGATFSYKGKRRTSTFEVTRVTSEGVYSVRIA